MIRTNNENVTILVNRTSLVTDVAKNYAIFSDAALPQGGSHERPQAQAAALAPITKSTTVTSDTSVNSDGGDMKLLDQSLLVLMSTKIEDEADIVDEIRRVQEDYSAVCSIHHACQWIINVVLDSNALRDIFQEAAKKLPTNVKCQTKVFSGNFNKFSYLLDLVDEMKNWDLVLFKDGDQRINTFSWRTFIEKRSNAVISGPLRRDKTCAESRQAFQLHRACHYESSSSPFWSSHMYNNVVPIEVPLLEMYFVLFDAKFANFFFGRLLTEEFVNQPSSWGPDFLWCAAAKSWDSSRPGCSLVPLVSQHEDTRKMKKHQEFRTAGNEMLMKFKKDPVLGIWMEASSKWMRIVHSKDLHKIEHSCRSLLGLDENDSFDLQACSRATITIATKTSADDVSSGVDVKEERKLKVS